jgi:acyl-CoA reductase-like NAD-dependent aldehyde dehydrogenase
VTPPDQQSTANTTQREAGTLVIPEARGQVPATPLEDVDAAITTLVERAPAWSATSVRARIELLDDLLSSTLHAAPGWTLTAAQAKGLASDSPTMGEDWINGPVSVLYGLRALRRTLVQIEETGRPQPPEITTAENGQVRVTVAPADLLDRALLPGVSAEVRLQHHVGLEQARDAMGRIYRPGGKPEPSVALVLGAGNVSSIAPLDVLTQLFHHDRVVVLKMNPVNEVLGPHMAEAFEPLVARGFLRIVYGGAQVGQHVVDHPDVAAVHLTGSDKTHDAIVFGTGAEGAKRKAEATPRIDKEVTAELGNVTPIIVVPGPWSDKDLTLRGRHIAAMLTNNAGFNCIAARLIIQHRSWNRRGALIDAVRDALRASEQRHPYYPGARERWQRFVEAYGQSEVFGDEGDEGDDKVPFTLIPQIDPDHDDDLALTTEAFCGVMGEVALDAPRSVVDYVDRAVDFCNEQVWGSLTATILVHPASLRDPLVADAVERAIDRLEYGAVVVNDWASAAYGMPAATWGAYPGAPPEDIGSGCGVVHNAYLLEDVEKTVCRAPWKPMATPVWYPDHRTLPKLAPLVARFLATEDPKLLPKLLYLGSRG